MKIAWLSDLDLSGSGYLNLSIPLCSGLAARGHEVKVAALGYNGTEHNYDFSLIPAKNMQEALAVAQNLFNLWKFDAFVVALDIPIQEQILRSMMQKPPFKYVGIMPVEADPLCLSWAMALMQMDKVFVISQFGTDEAKKVGIDAEHIQLGIDTNSWRIPEAEERKRIRGVMGFDDDTFAVLTVADNQERKNLSHALDVFAKFAENKPNAKYVFVTRENNPVGWRLRDYATELGISNKVIIFERGMMFSELWAIYASCDMFFLSSKAEGLGMPLLEAMSVGLPILATDCTAIHEVLDNGRGVLAKYDYIHRDPFGNGKRYWIDRMDALEKMEYIYENISTINIDKARRYVMGRTWDIAVDTLESGLLKLMENKNEEPK
jgi:glycosyltransferase involved in cell wall biosynthesis